MRDQSNGTKYYARLGADALLNCKVTSLEQDLVSWFRRDAHDPAAMPVVLTVGFRPHSAENRFILDFEPPNNYRLRVRNVQWRDEGLYLCQLSVHPPSLMWSVLELERPLVHILDGDGHPVADLHHDAGSTIDIICRVRRPPHYQVSLRWEAHTLASRSWAVTSTSAGVDRSKTGAHILNRDVSRGGVRIVTGREEDTGLLISRLSLVKARASDTGNYTCRLMSVPENPLRRQGLADTIAVHVLKGENTEAIYSRARRKEEIADKGLVILAAILGSVLRTLSMSEWF